MTYATEVLADSPLIYWRLGEQSGTNANDASPNNNDGTYFGAVQLGAGGLQSSDADTGIRLAGSDTDDLGAHLPFTNADVPNFTLEAIVSFDDLREAYGYQFIAGFNLSFADIEINLSNVGVDDNQLSGTWRLFGSGHSHNVASGVPVALGTTYHVAMVKNPTDTRLYIDGVLVDTDTTFAGEDATIGTDAFFVGDNDLGPGNGSHVTGVVDEAAFYTTALSAARILAHYNAMETVGDAYLAVI